MSELVRRQAGRASLRNESRERRGIQSVRILMKSAGKTAPCPHQNADEPFPEPRVASRSDHLSTQ